MRERAESSWIASKRFDFPAPLGPAMQVKGPKSTTTSLRFLKPDTSKRVSTGLSPSLDAGHPLKTIRPVFSRSSTARPVRPRGQDDGGRVRAPPEQCADPPVRNRRAVSAADRRVPAPSVPAPSIDADGRRHQSALLAPPPDQRATEPSV